MKKIALVLSLMGMFVNSIITIFGSVLIFSLILTDFNILYILASLAGVLLVIMLFKYFKEGYQNKDYFKLSMAGFLTVMIGGNVGIYIIFKIMTVIGITLLVFIFKKDELSTLE